ncbi:MBL fold metallo-hydrolase [Paracoccus sp. DMF-8]|uniref:MBL fold metallo-hydrolase n=1 Tax=Paracoccus sp. DMF-8 TaxID=3019445 RepID=UPI0023E8B132|nr:MBL fold metallo-hydrolase [Paracoccus sp. DMF-8]MDF3606492.1 MBL fold metallo-hydrolase [Paracoccus sp. DMF-8]
MTKTEKTPRVILAPNPSPLTGPGTNTFLLGEREIAVIDPGPDIAGHLSAIMAAAGKGRITHIFVTHAHLDHSAGARALADAVGAPILAYGPAATAGRSPVMQRLADQGYLGGGEGLDAGFTPDIALRDGDEVACDEWSLRALHTPGHFGGHLAFAQGDAVYCGDLVMGWSSTLISPPDGDLTDYMRSLARLDALSAARLLPAHGDAIDAPAARLAELATHRRQRTAQIMTALSEGPADAETLARRIYDVAPRLMPAATRNVLAHLIALSETGAVSAPPRITADAVFSGV